MREKHQSCKGVVLFDESATTESATKFLMDDLSLYNTKENFWLLKFKFIY